MLTSHNLIEDIRNIIAQSRDRAIRAVDHERTLMYWHIGKRIFEEEQNGEDRAEYGTQLIKSISKSLQSEYGSGFSYRQLNLYRQFYRTFPIVHALHSQLSKKLFFCRKFFAMLHPNPCCVNNIYYLYITLRHCYT